MAIPRHSGFRKVAHKLAIFSTDRAAIAQRHPVISVPLLRSRVVITYSEQHVSPLSQFCCTIGIDDRYTVYCMVNASQYSLRNCTGQERYCYNWKGTAAARPLKADPGVNTARQQKGSGVLFTCSRPVGQCWAPDSYFGLVSDCLLVID